MDLKVMLKICLVGCSFRIMLEVDLYLQAQAWNLWRDVLACPQTQSWRSRPGFPEAVPWPVVQYLGTMKDQIQKLSAILGLRPHHLRSSTFQYEHSTMAAILFFAYRSESRIWIWLPGLRRNLSSIGCPCFQFSLKCKCLFRSSFCHACIQVSKNDAHWHLAGLSFWLLSWMVWSPPTPNY